jgi:hypothetical protein
MSNTKERNLLSAGSSVERRGARDAYDDELKELHLAGVRAVVSLLTPPATIFFLDETLCGSIQIPRWIWQLMNSSRHRVVWWLKLALGKILGRLHRPTTRRGYHS